jgi:hypothetical protein
VGERVERIRPPFSGKNIGRLIDPGIRREVKILWENGIETFESCEGGRGHSFPEPTVRFHGGQSEGPPRSLWLQDGLPSKIACVSLPTCRKCLNLGPAKVQFGLKLVSYEGAAAGK